MFESTAIITRRPPCALLLELYCIGLEGGTRSTARSTENERRGYGAARLAVDGQREVAGRLVRDRPPALVDDVDVDRHQVERPT
jgi:hypothetical protein